MRSGHTLAELAAVLTICAILFAGAVPALGTHRDRAAVHAATTEISSALDDARRGSLLRSMSVALVLDTRRAQTLLIAAGDTILLAAVGGELGVTLEATRDTVRFAPTGRAYGASNTTILLRRGSAADTITISRLGRIRVS